MVVAGGGGGGELLEGGGGGGAGGYRASGYGPSPLQGCSIRIRFRKLFNYSWRWWIRWCWRNVEPLQDQIQYFQQFTSTGGGGGGDNILYTGCNVGANGGSGGGGTKGSASGTGGR